MIDTPPVIKFTRAQRRGLILIKFEVPVHARVLIGNLFEFRFVRSH